MNLIIDIGNTSIKAALFEGRELREVHRDFENSSIAALLNKYDVQNVLLASVAVLDTALEQELLAKSNLINLRSAKLPIQNRYGSPDTLGQDRLAAAVGAHATYPDKNCLVIDAGTCITYELITAKGEYLGGAISPGLQMRLRAMHTFTGRLPLVSMVSEPDLLGTDTATCMQSGALNGAVAEVVAMIGRYSQDFDDLYVILCGGDTGFFESKINTAIFAHPNLVPIGLNEILLFNI